MIRKRILLISLSLMLLFTFAGCSKPTSYYTNPQSAGYNQQGLGAICEHCGKMMKISGNQLQNVPMIKCPSCGRLSNTRNAAARWVPVKNQRDQQANQQMAIAIMQGTANGLNSYNKARYPVTTAPTTYNYSSQYKLSDQNTNSPLTATSQESGCTSDFSCGVGSKCVKAPLKSRGTCMTSVNEYGTKTYAMPNGDSVGINMDMDGQCSFDTDCPIGFKCDRNLKACIKR